MARRKASRPAENGRGAPCPVKRRRVANTDAEDEKSDATLAMLDALLEGVLILAKEVGHVSAAGIAASRRARNLMALISDALPEDPVIQTLDFDGHRKHINSLLEKLKGVSGTDCIDDFVDQWAYMGEISEDIAQWLPKIWDVLQAGGNFLLARTCIAYCAESVQAIENCDTAADYSDHTMNIFVGNDGEGMSWWHINSALAWFWRELLIKAETQKADSLSSIIYADLQTFDLTDHVFDLMKERDEDNNKQERFDEHWTPAMRTTVEQLILRRHTEQTEQFMEGPTLALYNKIVSDTLQPALIERVREALASPRCLIPLKDAVEILKKNDLFDDIISLGYRIDCDSKLVCSIARILSNSRSTKEAYGTEALKMMREGLAKAHTDVMAEIREVFPGLDAACAWFADNVRTKYDIEVLKGDPEKLDKAGAQDLKQIVAEFVERAKGEKPPRFRWGKDKGKTSLSRPILCWIQTLVEWPSRAESEEVWNAVRWKTNDDPFGVNGILQRMSDVCEEQEKTHHLSEGIRTMMKVYACKDVEALPRYEYTEDDEDEDNDEL